MKDEYIFLDVFPLSTERIAKIKEFQTDQNFRALIINQLIRECSKVTKDQFEAAQQYAKAQAIVKILNIKPETLE